MTDTKQEYCLVCNQLLSNHNPDTHRDVQIAHEAKQQSIINQIERTKARSQ